MAEPRPIHALLAADRPAAPERSPVGYVRIGPYALWWTLETSPNSSCWIASPWDHGPRIPHFLRLLPGIHLDHDASPAAAAALELHRQRLLRAMDLDGEQRRRARAIETLYEALRHNQGTLIATLYLPGASLSALHRGTRPGEVPLSAGLRTLLLLEGSRLLDIQHRAGYTYGALRASCLRLVLGHGPPLQLVGSYPLAHADAQLQIRVPDIPDPLSPRTLAVFFRSTRGFPHAAAPLLIPDRLALGVATLAADDASLRRLLEENSTEAVAVLQDELVARCPAGLSDSLAHYLRGEIHELPELEVDEQALRRELRALWQRVLAFEEGRGKAPSNTG